MASLGRATEWLNSPPLTAAGLRGRVVLVEFWTYTCINWLRVQPYVRAWAEDYEKHGLVVIGVHAPEFSFEHDIDNVRRAASNLSVDYPIAIDNDFAIWRAFDNHFWPALYFVNSDGRVRDHRFGEGDFARSELIIRSLLVETGVRSLRDETLLVDATGMEAPPDWDNLQSPETYLGYDRTRGFASPGGPALNRGSEYAIPEELMLNSWALGGDWTMRGESALLNESGGGIAHRFHARDLHLVMGAAPPGASVPFQVLIDGQPPYEAHGLDVDGQGDGVVSEPRLYQLVRQPGAVAERTFEITFHDPGVEVLCIHVRLGQKGIPSMLDVRSVGTRRKEMKGPVLGGTRRETEGGLVESSEFSHLTEANSLASALLSNLLRVWCSVEGGRHVTN